MTSQVRPLSKCSLYFDTVCTNCKNTFTTLTTFLAPSTCRQAIPGQHSQNKKFKNGAYTGYYQTYCPRCKESLKETQDLLVREVLSQLQRKHATLYNTIFTRTFRLMQEYIPGVLHHKNKATNLLDLTWKNPDSGRSVLKDTGLNLRLAIALTHTFKAFVGNQFLCQIPERKILSLKQNIERKLNTTFHSVIGFLHQVAAIQPRDCFDFVFKNSYTPMHIDIKNSICSFRRPS